MGCGGCACTADSGKMVNCQSLCWLQAGLWWWPPLVHQCNLCTGGQHTCCRLAPLLFHRSAWVAGPEVGRVKEVGYLGVGGLMRQWLSVR